jgi:hypothetical protein
MHRDGRIEEIAQRKTAFQIDASSLLKYCGVNEGIIQLESNFISNTAKKIHDGNITYTAIYMG